MEVSLLALDASARYYDDDGRLHVRTSHISKANVCEYLGSEIPDAEALGLDANKLYRLLRDPEELARAAPTFNNLQVLIKHVPVTAEEPSREHTVGSTGTDAAFVYPYLDNSLVVWDGEGIAAVEQREQCQLSAAYRYTADMRPGVFDGSSYDGVMRDMRGNHIALVRTGRAGSDVVVMDEALAPEENRMKTRRVTLSPRAAVAKGAIMTYLLPRLAQDQKMPDLGFLSGVTARNWSTPRIAEQTMAALKGTDMRVAMDADLGDVSKLLDHFKGEDDAPPPEVADVPADDPTAGPAMRPEFSGDNPKISEDDDLEMKVREMLQGKLDDADMEMLLKLIRPEEAPMVPPVENEEDSSEEDAGEDAAPPALAPSAAVVPPLARKEKEDNEPMIKKPAMDAAIKLATDAAVQRAVTETTRRMNALHDARTLVRPWIGEIAVAMDSAEAVLAYALESMGVATKGIHPSAYRAMLNLVPLPGTGARRFAQDSATPDKGFLERFPNAGRVRVMG